MLKSLVEVANRPVDRQLRLEHDFIRHLRRVSTGRALAGDAFRPEQQPD